MGQFLRLLILQINAYHLGPKHGIRQFKADLHLLVVSLNKLQRVT